MREKNIMNRLTALIISMIMAIGILYVPANAASAAEESKNEIGLLRAVGILPNEDLSAEKMTRANFALYTTRLMGMSAFDENNERYFYDVPMNHYALNSINKLVELGIISLDDEKKFRPDDVITLEEACKMLVSALGYDEMARVKGGYPTGYLLVSNMIGVTSNLNENELSTSTAISMLYNALKADVEDVISISDKTTYKKANGETALSVFHGISFAEGTLTATDGQTMYNDLNTESGQAYIDDTRYDCSLDLSNLFGSYIEYYYKDGTSSAKEIIYAEELSDKSVIIDSDDFLRYSNGTVYYSKNDRETSVSTKVGGTVVYNGRPITTDIDNAVNNINYGVITIKQSRNNENDLMIIEDYVDMYVSAVSEKMESISDSKLTNSVIEIKDWETIIIKDESGNIVDYKDVPGDTILSIKKSNDKKLLSGYVSSAIASGAAERLSEENGRAEIVVESTSYKLTKDCTTKFKSNIKLGSVYKYYMNYNGKIAYINTNSATNMVPGYLTNAIKNDNSFDNNLKIRILTENGKRVVYETTDKVKIDGVDYTEADKMIAAFPSESGDKTRVEPQLIMYKLSGEKIKEIDTYGGDAANEDKKNTLMRYKPEWNERSYKSNRFGWKILVRTGGKLFTVPSDDNINSASDKKFATETTNGTTFSLLSGKDNNEFYKLGTDAIFYDYITSKGDASYPLDDAYLAIVNDIYETMDSDEQIINAISVLSGRDGAPTMMEYSLNEGLDVSGLEKGDTVRVAVSGNTVMDYELIYDESSNDLPNKFPGSKWQGVTDYWNLYQPNTYYGEAFQLSFGYVNSKSDDVLRWGYKSAANSDESWNQYISSSTGGSRIMIWDTEQKKAYTGSLADVIDFETYGRGSRVILQTCWLEFRAMVVYI